MLLAGGELHVVIDGKSVDFTGVSKPRIVNGRAYARACTISEPLGAKMMTYLTTDKHGVVIDKGARHIELPFETRRIVVDGEGRDTETPGLLIKGEGFFPIRQIAEELGAMVWWDSDKRTIMIRTKHARL